MATSLVVLDTNIVIFLVSTGSRDQEADRKTKAVHFCIEEMQKQGCIFVVPAPVVAELGRDTVTPRERIRLLRRKIGAMRVLSLTKESAEVANEMAREMLSKRPEGQERGVIKYDVLIAAIAHQEKAKYIVTDNFRDYRKPLSVVNSPVEVVDATSPPEKGQSNLFQFVPRSS